MQENKVQNLKLLRKNVEEIVSKINIGSCFFRKNNKAGNKKEEKERRKKEKKKKNTRKHKGVGGRGEIKNEKKIKHL